MRSAIRWAKAWAVVLMLGHLTPLLLLVALLALGDVSISIGGK